MVRTEGRSDKRYEGAVRAAAAACTLESQNARYLITLAGAQYRLGRNEHALSTLARVNKLGIREEDSDAHALLQIFTAMCHSGLEHPEQASKALSEARKLVRDDSDRTVRTLFGEASALLGDSR